jgi:cysteine desulfurase / selenocysteine lyase
VSPIDLERARRDTPGCESVLHFNNAGAALMPRPVLDATVLHLRMEAQYGAYESAARAREAVERVYSSAARLLRCACDEVAVVDSATRAWDMAFYSLRFASGDRILTGEAEYASNYIAFLQVARRTGARVEVVPSEPRGGISVGALRDALARDDRARLVALTHVPTNGGLVNPAAEVGRAAREAGVPFLLDACQSVGQMGVDVSAIGCDMLSATGRKYLRAPRGTGLLYVRRGLLETLEPPFLDLHSATWVAKDRFEVRGDARRFETWEGNVAGKIGLGVAIDYALAWGLEPIAQRVSALAARLRDGLVERPGVRVHDLGAERCGIVTFTVDGRRAEEVRDALAARRINVSVSTRNSTLLDMEARDLDALVRASVHYYNSEDEVDRFCRELDAALDRT